MQSRLYRHGNDENDGGSPSFGKAHPQFQVGAAAPTCTTSHSTILILCLLSVGRVVTQKRCCVALKIAEKYVAVSPALKHVAVRDRGSTLPCNPANSKQPAPARPSPRVPIEDLGIISFAVCQV